MGECLFQHLEGHPVIHRLNEVQIDAFRLLNPYPGVEVGRIFATNSDYPIPLLPGEPVCHPVDSFGGIGREGDFIFWDLQQFSHRCAGMIDSLHQFTEIILRE